MADLAQRLQEKRRAPRFLGLYEVEYSVFNNLVEIYSKAFTKNISACGISLPINTSIRKGQRLFLKINPPYEEKPIFTQGVVIWKALPLESTQHENFCGIKFLRLKGPDRPKILKNALRSQPIPA